MSAIYLPSTALTWGNICWPSQGRLGYCSCVDTWCRPVPVWNCQHNGSDSCRLCYSTTDRTLPPTRDTHWSLQNYTLRLYGSSLKSWYAAVLSHTQLAIPQYEMDEEFGSCHLNQFAYRSTGYDLVSGALQFPSIYSSLAACIIYCKGLVEDLSTSR